MEIGCPACEARYRLDKAKIKGKGAKITCPRCGHRFAVYLEEDGGEPQVRELDAGSSSSEVQAQVPKPAGREVAFTPSRQRTADGAAEELDFKAVGIPTWKVKVAIGLVYDFSDIQTLRRYMRDKRVTEDDQISYDKKTWVRIGELDSLDAYFVDIWNKAKNGEIELPEDTSSRSNVGSRSGSVATRSFSTVPSMGVGQSASQSAAEIAIRRATARPESKRSRPEKPAGVSGPVVVLALLVFGCVAWGISKFVEPHVAEPVSGVPAGLLREMPEYTEADQARVRAEFAERWEADVEANAAARQEMDDEEGEAEAPRRLIPVRPSDRERAAARAAASEATPESILSTGQTTTNTQRMLNTGTQRRGVVSARDRATRSGSPGAGRSSSSSELTSAADTALGRGDYETAANLYAQVASSSGASDGRVWYQLGRSRAGAGQSAGAREAYQRASTLGVAVAFRELGRLNESAGRGADALRSYRAYLERAPGAPDRAQIESRISTLQ